MKRGDTLVTYEDLGVEKIINAVDTYTIIGGSLMPDEVMEAMVEASKHFVNIDELHDKASARIAHLTKNEAAFITNGAAAGLALSTAACMTGNNLSKIEQLPNVDGLKNEVVIHRSQRNGYDQAIRQVGVELIEFGYVDKTFPWQLEGAITENTACIIYFAATSLAQGALPLEEVIAIGKKHNIPVIVDAAAQLPPVENLWKYVEMGADLVLFSGGKTLRGPQSTGLIVGRKDLVHYCRLNSSPNHSIGRSMKIGKEEIMGLVAAIERYVNLDHDAEIKRMENIITYIANELQHPAITVKRIFPGPVGQTYPRAGLYFDDSSMPAGEVHRALEEGSPSIITGYNESENKLIINPLNLIESEVNVIIEKIKKILQIK